MMPKLLTSLVAGFLLATLCMAAEKPVSDDLLSDQVRIRLVSDQIVKGGALKVDVKMGVVTLSGAVENDKQKERAGKLTKKVKGVKEVINNITLRDKIPGK